MKRLKTLLFTGKLKLFVFLALVIFTIIRIIVDYWVTMNTNESDIVAKIHKKNLKAVQLLTDKFTYRNWGVSEMGEKPFATCAEKRCYAFKPFKIRQRPLEQSDGIMVHVPNLLYMPSRHSYKRNKRQLWLFNTMEPQTLTYCSFYYDIYDLDDWFNLTTTFKPQSTLVTDYKHLFNNWYDIHEYSHYMDSFNAKLVSDGANFLDNQLNTKVTADDENLIV